MAVCALTLLALTLRLVGLARQSIWADETFTIAYAAVFERMTVDRLLINLQGPFHALVLFVWTRLFGAGEAALRSLEAVTGAATVPIFWWALRPLGRPAAAFLACGLLAISPFHLWYSQEARNYAFAILLGIASMGAMARLPGTARNRVGYTVANALGLLSNLSHAFLLVTQGVGLILRGRAARSLGRTVAVSWAITALLLSPWLVQFWERHVVPSGALGTGTVESLTTVRGATTAPLLGIPYAYFAFATGFSYGPSLRELHGLYQGGVRTLLGTHLAEITWVAVVFGGVALIGAWRLWRAGPLARAWLLLAVLPVLLTLGVSLLNLKVFNARYAAAAFPAFLLLIGEGITAPRRRAVRWLVLGAVLLPAAKSVAAYYTDPRYAREDARGVDAYLRREAVSGDLLFTVGATAPLQGYYWIRAGGPPPGLECADAWPWFTQHVPFAEQFRRFESMVRGRRTFVLFLRAKDVDPTGRWAEYFARRGGIHQTVEFAGARVLVLPGGGP
jgi:4-amino-4-deoxy-L-arabinose transferase-like glycosyltransferase